MRPKLRWLLSASVAVGALAQATPVFVADTAEPLVERPGVSRGAAWGDYDGDGDPDLFVTHPVYDGPEQVNALYRNEAGRLVRVPTPFDDAARWRVGGGGLGRRGQRRRRGSARSRTWRHGIAPAREPGAVRSPCGRTTSSSSR